MSELDPESFELHDREMAREATMQQAVNEVGAMGLGHDVPAIMTALSRAIASRGLTQPPVDWLNAVAVELSHGNNYVVGPRSMQDTDAAPGDQGQR